MERTTQRVAFWLGVLVLGSVRTSHAGALNIPLDAFLGQFGPWTIGLLFIIGIVGVASWFAQHYMDNAYSPVLSGVLPMVTKAGIGGGMIGILGVLGLGAGATL